MKSDRSPCAEGGRRARHDRRAIRDAARLRRERKTCPSTSWSIPGIPLSLAERERLALLSFGIRAGRTDEVRQRIIRRCYDLLAEVTQAPPDQIFVTVQEGESSWIMEAGFILPEPNDADEAAWIAQLQQAYPGKYDQWGAHGKRPADQDGAGGAIGERIADLRRLAEQVVSQAEREGVSSLQLLEPLHQFVGTGSARQGGAGHGADPSASGRPE